MGLPSDIELIGSIADGDADAFAALYKKYSVRCANFAYSLTKDINVAKDLTHDVFLRLWTKGVKASAIRSVSSYLFTMMQNEVLMYFERERVRRRFLDYSKTFPSMYSESADGILDIQDVNMIISLAVDKMPHQQKRIFIMSRVEQISNKDIAEALDISVRTVEKHISNALSDIRSEFEKIIEE